MKEQTIFWDADTQADFMNPEGKLYMPGAMDIIENVSRIREYAIDNGYSIIASTDWHSLTDSEISENPDYIKTYPPHCLANEPGSKRVGFLGKQPIEYIDISEMKLNDLKRLVMPEQFHIVIRKNELGVFSNPNTSVLLGLLRPKKIFIFGVALEICVDITVKDLIERSIPDITVFSDAVKSLNSEVDEVVFKNMIKLGVKIKSFEKSFGNVISV
jgi:nicotinamidase/pyrazinamidase